MRTPPMKLEDIPGVQVLGARGGRDLDLLRAVLLDLSGAAGRRDFAAWDADLVREHVALLIEGGFLHGTCYRGEDGAAEMAVTGGLTWQGHELTDAIRSESVWRKVKETAKRAGGTLAMEMLKAVALAAGREAIG